MLRPPWLGCFPASDILFCFPNSPSFTLLSKHFSGELLGFYILFILVSSLSFVLYQSSVTFGLCLMVPSWLIYDFQNTNTLAYNKVHQSPKNKETICVCLQTAKPCSTALYGVYKALSLQRWIWTWFLPTQMMFVNFPRECCVHHRYIFKCWFSSFFHSLTEFTIKWRRQA